MNTQNPVTRRQFLKVSAGAGAGLILAIYLPGCQDATSPDQPADEMAEGQFSPSVFLKISPDNMITITVPRMEMGQGVRTAMPMVIAEELDADWSTVRVETAPAGEEYGNQETGGSNSIEDYWMAFRQAGAAAKAMLIAAAAQTWNVDAASCVAQNGEVIHPESGRRASYGELAASAAQMPLPSNPENLPLKDPQDFQIIGQSVKRIDDPQFVDGSAIFGLDVKVPDMRYAAIARSPVFWGKPAKFDDAKAKAIEGVLDVVEIDNAIAVVAENSWAAIKGRDALEITWDEGEMATVSSDGIRQSVLAQLPDSVAIGNTDAQAQANGKLEVLYEMPYLAHAPMEPMNCVADARSDNCEVWAPTQNPQAARQVVFAPPNDGRVDRLLRRFTGWPLEAIKINVPLMGGAFGRRLNVDYVEEAVKVSRAIKQPVQVVWTREDDIQHDFYHPQSFHYVSAELDVKAEMQEQLFENLVPIPWGAWRSVHHFTKGYVEECFVDELAVAMGQDPYEFRMQRYDDPRLKNVLKLAAEKSDWGSPLPAGWGRGIAAFKTWDKSPTAEVVELSVADDGTIKVHRVVCVVDCGIVVNPDMVVAQMEGGIVFALTAAIKSKVTIEKGRVVQSNFHNYPVLRMDEMPQIEVHIVPGSEPPTGVGEMSGPPLTPAVANAVFAATGKRVRHIPIQPEDLK